MVLVNINVGGERHQADYERSTRPNKRGSRRQVCHLSQDANLLIPDILDDSFKAFFPGKEFQYLCRISVNNTSSTRI